ncbi:hypothetical protein ACMXYV_06950 [Neptuniibacter sp. SY11_33]|uniref:hypothetical protein n=1 Tax=Neptuniibacter sp. SY11_33 TaxID=3398215 RepID=UPI0039F4C134
MYYLKVTEPEASCCQVIYPYDIVIKSKGPKFRYKRDVRVVDKKQVSLVDRDFCVLNVSFERPFFTNYPPKMNVEHVGAIGFYTSPAGVHLVNDKFKKIVEDFDPGVHYFWPVDVNINGQSTGGYYYMIVGRVIDFSEDYIEGFENTPFIPSGGYVDILQELNEDPDVASCLSNYPIFSCKGYCRSIVVSDALVDILKSEVIVGLWDKNNIPDVEFYYGIRKIKTGI